MHRLARAAVLVASFVACTGARAADPLDVTGLFARAAEFAEATVILVPPTVVFSRPLDEPAVRKAGCRHTTIEIDAIRSLVAIIHADEPSEMPVFQRPDMRAVVHLAKSDGYRVSLYLQDNQGSRLPVVGTVEVGSTSSFRTVPINARSTLMTDLRDWARRSGGPGEGAACDDAQKVTRAG